MIKKLAKSGIGSTNIVNLVKKKVNLFSLELLPRITRAQSMDILSSQANLAGYKAVIEALSRIHHWFIYLIPITLILIPSFISVFYGVITLLFYLLKTPSLAIYSHASDPAICGQRGSNVSIIRQQSLKNLSVDEVEASLQLR